MDDNNKKHYNQKIWEMRDGQITSNTLSVSIHFSKDNYGTSCVRLQFNITNHKSRIRTNFSMSHQQLTKLLAMLKPNEDNVRELKDEIESNPDSAKAVKVSDLRKFVVTYLSRSECGGFCVRISIGEHDRRIIDSESVYIPYIDFKSLLRSLVDFRDSFSTITTNMAIFPYLEQG